MEWQAVLGDHRPLRGRRLRALGVLLTISLMLVASGPALAFTYGSGVQALTRNGQVAWKFNTTIETNSLVVKANEIVIGSQRLDFQPDGLQKITVYTTRYSLDYRTFRVVMAEGTQTGLNVTYTNSGSDLKVYEAGINTKTCAAEVSPCSWVFTNNTDFNFSVLTPAGVAQLAAEQGAPPPAVAGGGGGSSAPAAEANPRAENPLAELPNPLALFPRLTALHWLAIIAGAVLVFNGLPRTRAILPFFLRLPIPALWSLGVGSAILVYIYLSPMPV